MYNVIAQLEHQSCGGVVEHATKARNGYVHSVKSYGQSCRIVTTSILRNRVRAMKG
jgi:hypothetical protein